MLDMQFRLEEVLGAQYTIEREIGSGSLACVFLATERKHGRQIAMKVLRPHLTAGITSTRFRREIAIVSTLHHPHILPLFDSGEVDDILYFTMPYVQGPTLRGLLTRDKMLPISDATSRLRSRRR